MLFWTTHIASFLRGPDLPPMARRTYRWHLAYALFDAAAGGIISITPTFALKAIGGQSWQMPLRELYAAIGMLVTLYLGCWMASRRKMPFVVVPGLLCGLSSLTMALAIPNAFWFLTLLGVGAMFEIMTRPATATILRLNYPVAQRGHATGSVRTWSSLTFVVSILLSAYLLQVAGDAVVVMARVQVVLAGVLSMAGFLCFRQVPVNEDPVEQRDRLPAEITQNLRDAVQVVRNARYRRYLVGCFVDGFSGALYFPLIWAFLGTTLGFKYVGCAMFMHAIPALTTVALTGWLGRWFDRSNPWVSWAWIRFAWGLDALLLAATPFTAAIFPSALIVLPLTGRLLRGSVQGGQWVLWWQIGVTHFAPPGQDTSRYMGVMVFLNGATRLTASAMGMVLASLNVPTTTILTIGGAGVILSGAYSLAQARRERREHRPQTVSEFESQCLARTLAVRHHGVKEMLRHTDE
jgi:hypothetical protein